MLKREKLLILSSLLQLEADFAEAGCTVNPVTLRGYARELERIAARDAWAPLALVALGCTVATVGGLLWHVYVL